MIKFTVKLLYSFFVILAANTVTAGKRSLFIAFGILLGISVLIVPLTASAQSIFVDQSPRDFGDVLVDGGPATQSWVLLSNGETPLTITDVEITDDLSGLFSILSGPSGTTILLPEASVDVVVEFDPTSVGVHTAYLHIVSDSDDGDDNIYIQLSGAGVTDPTPVEALMRDLLDEVAAAFYNDGSLYGIGPGNSAENRARAFENMLYAANDLIAAGDDEGACGQLLQAYRRLDGEGLPPDFVHGTATAAIGAQISAVMDALGCP